MKIALVDPVDESKVRQVKRVVPLVAGGNYKKHTLVIEIESIADTPEEAAQIIAEMVAHTTWTKGECPIKSMGLGIP